MNRCMFVCMTISAPCTRQLLNQLVVVEKQHPVYTDTCPMCTFCSSVFSSDGVIYRSVALVYPFLLIGRWLPFPALSSLLFIGLPFTFFTKGVNIQQLLGADWSGFETNVTLHLFQGSQIILGFHVLLCRVFLCTLLIFRRWSVVWKSKNMRCCKSSSFTFPKCCNPVQDLCWPQILTHRDLIKTLWYLLLGHC